MSATNNNFGIFFPDYFYHLFQGSRSASIEINAKKLELLMENQELRTRMGTAGRLRFEKKFTLNHFENCLSETLKKAMVS